MYAHNILIKYLEKILRENNIKSVRGINPKKGKSTKPEKIETICYMARQGKTAQEIVNYYNEKGFKHSVTHIYKILEKNNIFIKKANDRSGIYKKICDMFDSGIHYREIAKQLGYKDPYSVSEILKINNRRATKILRKRGEIIKNNGYVLIRVSKDDPMACMRAKSGLILEHRLVMARKLNRPLLKSETVHHIDGNRENNNIENLQLHINGHGKGQCMECYDCHSENIILKDWFHCGNCNSNKIVLVAIKKG